MLSMSWLGRLSSLVTGGTVIDVSELHLLNSLSWTLDPLIIQRYLETRGPPPRKWKFPGQAHDLSSAGYMRFRPAWSAKAYNEGWKMVM